MGFLELGDAGFDLGAAFGKAVAEGFGDADDFEAGDGAFFVAGVRDEVA